MGTSDLLELLARLAFIKKGEERMNDIKKMTEIEKDILADFIRVDVLRGTLGHKSITRTLLEVIKSNNGSLPIEFLVKPVGAGVSEYRNDKYMMR
jgi:hypothetical protein